jgi:hypothetical protein
MAQDAVSVHPASPYTTEAVYQFLHVSQESPVKSATNPMHPVKNAIQATDLYQVSVKYAGIITV